MVVAWGRRRRDSGLAAIVIVRARAGSGRDLADVLGGGLFVTGMLGWLVRARRVPVLRRMAGGAAGQRRKLHRKKTRRDARDGPGSQCSGQRQ